MEKLSEYGEKYRRILTYFLKKNQLYNEFIANTKYYYAKANKNDMFYKRQYYNGIFNHAAWNNEGLIGLFRDFFPFSSSKYPKRIRLSSDTFEDSNIFSRFEFWTRKSEEWENFIYKRGYEEITTLI